MHPLVEELKSLITTNHWEKQFGQGFEKVRESGLQGTEHYADLDSMYHTLDDLLHWAPRVPSDPRHAFETPLLFYYMVDQEPLKSLQSPVRPAPGAEPLSPLSAWMVKMALAYGEYLDTPASLECIETFKAIVAWDDYMPPPSGYHTFNQFFARHIKPGKRPVAEMENDRAVVSPADSVYVGSWPISDQSEIDVQEPMLDLKGLQWSIHQLLDGSQYADRFKGGLFTHSFLNVNDYHRWHSPVRGKLVEARVIQGQVYMDVRTKQEMFQGKPDVIMDIVDSTGFQFVQTRGVLVLDSPIGLVACIPVGMALVSSVKITAEVGSVLRKGEEMGYFQFGGSDFVMVFERSADVKLLCEPMVHYNQGVQVGNAKLKS